VLNRAANLVESAARSVAEAAGLLATADALWTCAGRQRVRRRYVDGLRMKVGDNPHEADRRVLRKL
jgi:hypothetical protein